MPLEAVAGQGASSLEKDSNAVAVGGGGGRGRSRRAAALVPALVILAGGCMIHAHAPPAVARVSVAVAEPVTLEDFRVALAPYGTWIQHPTYGLVWAPYVAVVGADFQPYDCGSWLYSEYGWTWSSCYPWGWAPFHYGRWFFSAPLGWAWIPGYEWAPAWVEWRFGGGYVGWQPLGPAGYAWPLPVERRWRFVAAPRLGDTAPSRYVPRSSIIAVFDRAAPIPPGGANGSRSVGPPPREVERLGGPPVVRRPVQTVPRAVAPPRAR